MKKELPCLINTGLVCFESAEWQVFFGKLIRYVEKREMSKNLIKETIFIKFLIFNFFK